MRVLLLSLAAVALCVGAAAAGDCCSKPSFCGDCGQKTTCKVVCEMKKVVKHVWVVECEPICIANPGCGRGCDTACCAACGTENSCGCGKCDPCAELLGRPMVKPECGRSRCRKKLVKKEIVCEVPTYKCVVVPCGCGCGAAGGCDVRETAVPAGEKSVIRAAPLPPRVVGISRDR